MQQKMFVIWVCLASLFLVGCMQSTAPVATSVIAPIRTPVPVINSMDTIISDMQLKHDAKPHGVPDHYDWASGPRLGRGNNPGEFTAIIPWGQVYECAGGNPAANTRVHLRNIALYILSKSSGEWKLVQNHPTIEGAAYVEDFQGDASKDADVRNEPEGGVSVTAGGGYNYHFFTKRDTIDPNDIAGVFSTIQARLILNDPNGPDDRAQACYLLSMGADYWRDLTVGWNAQFTNNGDVGIGRFKFVTQEWQAFNMISLTGEELLENPPPLE